MATREELGSALTTRLRALRRLGEGRDDRERRTRLFRDVAESIVDLREHFDLAGEPDWAGRSPAYRRFIRDCYRDAGYPRDEAQTIQRRLSYHVSTRLRERVDPERLEDLGLKTDDVTSRVRDRRLVQSAKLATLDERAEGTPDAVRALAGALVVLQRITPDDLAALDGAAVGQARAVLARLTDRVAELRRLTEAAV